MSIWNRAAFPLAIACLGIASCGYHVVGTTNALVPKDVHTIAIPAFSNGTVRYKLTDLLPEAIGREFITRTHYKLVDNPDQADAILKGTVITYIAYPTLIDQSTGRTSGLQVNVTLQVSLVERSTGKIIYTRPNFEAHQRYELSTTSNAQYFDESNSSLQRLSRDVARDLVSSILENF